MTLEQVNAIAEAAQPFVNACLAQVNATEADEWHLFISEAGAPIAYLRMARAVAGRDHDEPDYLMGFHVFVDPSLSPGDWRFVPATGFVN